MGWRTTSDLDKGRPNQVSDRGEPHARLSATTTSKDALVSLIKDFQRHRSEDRVSWHHFVRGLGSTNYDPVRHDAERLIDFLSSKGICTTDQPQSPDHSGNEEQVADAPSSPMAASLERTRRAETGGSRSRAHAPRVWRPVRSGSHEQGNAGIPPASSTARSKRA